MQTARSLIVILVISLIGCTSDPTSPEKPVQAFCIDYNWGPGGAHGFAKPGLWADADPIDSLQGGDLNIAILARVYNGLPFDYVKTK